MTTLADVYEFIRYLALQNTTQQLNVSISDAVLIIKEDLMSGELPRILAFINPAFPQLMREAFGIDTSAEQVEWRNDKAYL